MPKLPSFFSKKKSRSTPASPNGEQSPNGDTPLPATGSDQQEASKGSGTSSSSEDQKGKRGTNVVATAADVDDPRALVAEALGHQAVTLARTNSTLKFTVAGLSVATLLMSVFAFTAFNKPPQYRYFFMASNGTIFERQPLSDPVVGLNGIRDFVSESLSNLFSFHYKNFDTHYQRLAPTIMTEQAMIDFSNEMDRIGLIKSMQERREVAEAVMLQSPVLNASGVDPKTGVYTWEMSIPFILRLESGLKADAGTVRQMRGVARVKVIRVEPTQNPRQFLINRITIRDTAQ